MAVARGVRGAGLVAVGRIPVSRAKRVFNVSRRA